MEVTRLERCTPTRFSEVKVGETFTVGLGSYTFMKVSMEYAGLGAVELETGMVRQWKTDLQVTPIKLKMQEQR